MMKMHFHGKSQVDKLRERFGVRHVTLVGNRGLIKSAQIEDRKGVGFHYITAITKPQIEALIEKLNVGAWVVLEQPERAITTPRDEEKKQALARLDGRYVIKSDLPQTAADKQTVHDRYKDLTQVEHVIPWVPVQQWVLSFPIPLRLLFAAHPELLTPVLQIVHRVISTFLIKQAGLQRTEADTGAITLIQRFGSAANLNIHLHCLVLDGVYRTTEGVPVFHAARAPTDGELQALLSRIIRRIMQLLTADFRSIN
jgi:hypothetical protein